MKITVLGSGTSTGVPQIGCNCEVCTSNDSKDKRLRASILITVNDKNILVDCGPDFRQQILRIGAPKIDALLLTHIHYDHVGGIEELRPNFIKGVFPIYCKADVIHDIKARIPYCFADNLYPGVPLLKLNEIGDDEFTLFGVKIQPLKIMHYKLPILGFRIGDFAYITDAKYIDEETLTKLKGVKVLILNALRITEHISHFSLSQALEIVNILKPEQTYLTHISHDMGLHSEVSQKLPDNVALAYDGLTLEL